MKKCETIQTFRCLFRYKTIQSHTLIGKNGTLEGVGNESDGFYWPGWWAVEGEQFRSGWVEWSRMESDWDDRSRTESETESHRVLLSCARFKSLCRSVRFFTSSLSFNFFMYKWKRIKWRMIRFVYIFCVCCVYFVFCFSFHPFHSNSAICRWFLSENLVKCVRSFLFWLFVDERILFSIPIEFITHTDKFLIHNKRPTQCLHQRSDMRCYYGLCLWYWCSINWMHVKNCIGRKRFSGGEVSVEYEGITCTGVELNEKQQRQWRLKKK